MATRGYVRIDVSRDRLDRAVLEERQEKQVDNTSQGIAQLVKQILKQNPELIGPAPEPITYQKGSAC